MPIPVIILPGVLRGAGTKVLAELFRPIQLLANDTLYVTHTQLLGI